MLIRLSPSAFLIKAGLTRAYQGARAGVCARLEPRLARVCVRARLAPANRAAHASVCARLVPHWHECVCECSWICDNVYRCKRFLFPCSRQILCLCAFFGLIGWSVCAPVHGSCARVCAARIQFWGEQNALSLKLSIIL